MPAAVEDMAGSRHFTAVVGIHAEAADILVVA
jgi:hypothetical protein